jgi:hypothetical protein
LNFDSFGTLPLPMLRMSHDFSLDTAEAIC